MAKDGIKIRSKECKNGIVADFIFKAKNLFCVNGQIQFEIKCFYRKNKPEIKGEGEDFYIQHDTSRPVFEQCYEHYKLILAERNVAFEDNEDNEEKGENK